MTRCSSNIYELQQVALAECVELFEGDRDAAERWMSQRVRGLGYKSPQDMLSSETGIEQLRILVGRLEHGIFN
ncbi:MAG: hypothetical protein AWU57_1525 [Marinobacter sp. T13-3]|nr:MAG: hypothetical protein AWU57_1525 [Marinobacter sp. T13-3]